MAKIQMTTPLVEMDGDEMTRIIWQMIKDELLPTIDLKTEYYDLGLAHRGETDDQGTVDPPRPRRLGVAVKCATITPNAARVEEYRPSRTCGKPQRYHPRHARRHGVPHPHQSSGHRAVRAQLDAPHHHRPPCLRRRLQNAEMRVPGEGKVELVYTAPDGTETRELVHVFDGPGSCRACTTSTAPSPASRAAASTTRLT